MPHFNPSQPRVPKGHDDGGQWTAERGGVVDPARLRRSPFGVVLEKGIEAVLALFAELSARNRRDQQAVIQFKAREYRPNEEKVLNLKDIRQLDSDEVRHVCPELPTVQWMTDLSAALKNESEEKLSAQQYGTAVHASVKRMIDRLGRDDLRAEVSFEKMKQEGVYGAPGSVRIDVLEYGKDRKVCVYDIKTGASGLTPARLHEIAQRVYGVYPDARGIVITEVRPFFRRRLDGVYR